jgi:predicted methyltransferase
MATDPAAVLSGVAATVGLREGEQGVEDVLRHLALVDAAPTRALSRRTGLPVPVVAAVCGELRRLGLLLPDRPARLSEPGRELAGLLTGGAPGAECTCPTCRGLGIAPEQDRGGLGRRLAGMLRDAPPADPRLDQAHCTLESKLRRIGLLREAGALGGRSVLLLGDDDFLGLAIATAAREFRGERPRRLVVLDIDPAVIDFTRRRLGRSGMRAELLLHDLRAPLPADLLAEFDTVVTDPPYTLPGAELFLSRGAAALRPGPGRHVFLCFGAKPPDESAALQHAITGMGFSIHRMVRNFNDYLGAGVLGGVSHLYHLVTGPRLSASVPGPFAGPLYTGQLRRPGRAYVCRGCRAHLRIGPDDPWPTIQDLRRQGCPRCDGRTFRPTDRGADRRRARR